MQKTTIAAIALSSMSVGASAQSNVTLAGIVDVKVRHFDNTGSGGRWSVGEGGLRQNRLIFRGTEDLGGGLGAGFWLEAGFAPDTDAGASTGGAIGFNRVSVVRLTSRYGEIRLGRDSNPTFNLRVHCDPTLATGIGAGVNVSRFLARPTFVRASNTVQYMYPASTGGGVYGEVMLAAGEGSVNTKLSSGRVGYTIGTCDVAVAVGEQDVATGKLKSTLGGASYDFGFARVMGYAAEDEVPGTTERTCSVATAVPIGLSEVRVLFARANDKETGATAKELMAQYVYFLSKRTAPYATASRISNSGGSAVAIFGSTPLPIAMNGKSTGFDAGIRHTF